MGIAGVDQGSALASELPGGERRVGLAIAERHKLEEIFRGTPAGMALWRGPELVFELVNPGYQAFFGARPLVGKPLLVAVPELANQPFAALMHRVLETGEPFSGHEVLAQLAQTDAGPLEDRYFDFTYVQICDADGAPYGVYDHAVDVTDRVLTRRALEDSNRRLAETVRDLEEERDLREHFVAALSHDLRTPLHAIKLSTQLLIHKASDPGALQRSADRIADNIDRADDMIRDLLDASRLKGREKLPLDVEACDLTKLARNTLEELASIHGDRFVLFAPTSLAGHWDEIGIRRILENLAANAVKYGSPSTPVSLTLAEVTDVADVAEIQSEVELRVHNHGSPIAPADLPSLFELFTRSAAASRSSQRGWGIGLSLVRGLASAHGGSCTVTSDAGTGTTFTIRLPRDARRFQ